MGHVEGDVVAGYRIVRPIGRGGMGAVYLADDLRLKRRVALKLLDPSLAADSEFRARFVTESRLAASLDHPHIIPIYEAGESAGELFIAMRFVDGTDLDATIARRGRLDVEETIGLLAGVADALDAAHARGLVHRDVKPANILLAPTVHAVHAYLADFGLARPSAAVSGFSNPGALVGSVDYVAPEHIEGQRLDGRADIYGLACVLVACLTGLPPFRRETDIATLWAHVQAPRPRLGANNADLARLDPVVAAGLAVDPTARPPTARGLIDAVASAWRDRPATRASDEPATPVETAASARPIPAAAAPQERQLRAAVPADRRVTTIVLTNLLTEGPLAETFDPEALRIVQDRFVSVARETFEAHGATVEKYMGDAVMAVFGLPAVREDDALRAVRAAVELHARDGELATRLGSLARGGLTMRSGVNTGEVLTGSDTALVTGDAVTVAARIQQAAEPGAVLVSPSTIRLVRHAVESAPAGSVQATGRGAPIEVHRIDRVLPEAETVARRHEGPFVGRQHELRQLSAGLTAAIEGRTVRAATVVGLPGVGKSRLVHEFLAEAHPTSTVLRGRALPYGDGVTWWPLVEVIHSAVGISGSDDADEARRKVAIAIDGLDNADLVERRIGSVLGVHDEPAPPQEVAWAVRVLLERLGSAKSVLVVVDDIQWADPALLDLLEHVADRLPTTPLMLLCIARPELREVRPEWMENRAFHELIRVDALDDRTTTELLDALLMDVALPDRARTQILEAAGGNPLFLEQILAMLVDDGYLARGPSGWSVARDMSTVSVPPTIAALLGARLERLSPPERATIERASVVGKVFWWGSVAELSPSEDRPAVGGHLTTLVRRELIRPDPVGPDATVFPGDEAFRFRHLLVRDAAYTRLPKASRADLHERFATWLEAHAGGASDYSAIVGYHLEQAVLYMRELAIDPELSDRLALRAAGLLGAAGMAAHEGGDIAAAVNLLTRAVDLWPPAAPERRDHLFALAGAMWAAGRADEGEDRLAELGRAVAAAPDERWDLRVRLRRADRAHVRGVEGSVAMLEAVAREALAAYEALEDPGLGALAWQSLGAMWIQQGKVRAEDEAIGLAMPLAVAAGDHRRIAIMKLVRANRAPAGERPVPDGIALCEGILDDRATGLELRATTLVSLGLLLGLDDRREDALRAFAEARRIVDELGLVMPLRVNDLPWEAAHVERWTGDLEVAERYLREAVAMQREMRDHWHLSASASALAEMITLQRERLDDSRRQEVRDLVDEARRVTLPEDAISGAQWRSTLARLMSFEGHHDEALALSSEACAIMDQTEELLFRFEARNTLHDVAQAAARVELAGEAATAALELARLKQSRLFERIALGYLAEA